MLILLSPAKTLDFVPTERKLSATKPQFATQANSLVKRARELSPKQLSKLMSISDSLADTAHGYFQDYKVKWDAKGTKQAALAFRGDVYQGLDADTLSDKQLKMAQNHLRLLSGLYGVLRPLDLIQPYRLEMGTRLKNGEGKDLYAYWGNQITESINQAAAEAASRDSKPVVINLASNEYFGVIDKSAIEAELITPVFKDEKNGKYKVISFFAKRARGMLARHLLQSGQSLDALKKFKTAGYRISKQESTPASPVFLRTQSAAQSAAAAP